MIVVFLLALLLASTAQAGTLVTRGPYLMMGSSDAMTIRWRTGTATDSRVWIGRAPSALVPAASDDALTTEHELRVTGLTPGSRVFYAIGTSSEVLAGGDSLWFEPAPRPGTPIRVWVTGDMGKPGYRQDAVRKAYLAIPGAVSTDAWILLGDNAYNDGTDGEYQAGLFVPYASFLRTHVVWPARGNHDRLYSGVDYFDVFTLPEAGEAGGMPSGSEAYYSFDCGDVHFICLDSEGTAVSTQADWLAGDLASTNRRWIVAFWHRPPYTKGSHDSDDNGRMAEMREVLMPVLEAGGVDLVLGGHSHDYERSYLIDGHYGESTTFLPSMKKDPGDGRPDGDGAYRKPPTRTPHAGDVAIVAGTASQDSPGPLDHPAMVEGYNGLGSVVLDISADGLRSRFLDDQGVVRDDFEILKGFPLMSGNGTSLGIALAGANPARGSIAFVVEGADDGTELSIVDVAGRVVERVPVSAGGATWNSNGSPAGVYFAVLERGGARRVAKVVLVP